MKVLIFLLALIIAVLITIILILSSRSSKREKFNSNIAASKEGPSIAEIKPAKFIVVKIEITRNSKDYPVAIYTLQNCYFAKENNECFVYEHYIIYDSIDKYNLGDILTFNKLER